MAESAIKLTAIFRDDFAGWTETYFFAKPSSATIQQMSEKFVQARIKVLGDSAYLDFVRIGATDTPRISDLYRYARNGIAQTGNGKTAVINLAEDAYRTILMPFKTNAGVRRFVTLSGVPDAWLERANDKDIYRINAANESSVNDYYNWLLDQKWALLIRVRKGGVGFLPTKLKAISVDMTSGQYLLTPDAGFVVNVGDKIATTKVKGNNLTLLKGIRKVTAVNQDGTFRVDRGPRQDLGPITYLAGGLVQLVGYTYDTALNTPEPYRVSTRKRGRPFAARRGRRSANR